MNFDEAPLNQTDEMINNFIEDCEERLLNQRLLLTITLPSLSFDILGIFLYNI